MKYTTDTYIERCEYIHNNKYDYTLVEYSRLRDNIKIICKEHGVFEQRAQAHLNGSSCIKCYKDSRNISQDEFINKCDIIHKSKYDYSNTVFTGSKSIINIICKKHGKFEQFAYKHLIGQGCSICANEKHRISLDYFIKKSRDIHKNKYDYSNVEYFNNSTKVSIICKKHGDFEQSPNNHTNGKGCPKCSKIVSNMETNWLDSIGIPNEFRQKTINLNNRIIKADAIDNINKIIYEFYGDYWHGNPCIYNPKEINKVTGLSFEELYRKTIEREKIILDSGFSIINIWESDYKNNIRK
jgi:hypothetical protein